MSWRLPLLTAAFGALAVVSFAPNSVTDLTAIAVTDSAATLRWTEVASNDSTQVAWYDLRWGLATGFGWAPRQSPLDTIRGTSRTGGVKLTTTVRGLKPATSYTFQTVACVGIFGAAICSPSLSNTASVTTAATPPQPPPPPPPVVVASVTVSPLSLMGTVSTLGVQVFATAKDALGTTLAVPITWTSSVPSVARVDSTGIVFFVSPGTASVSASAGGKSASVAVTVLAPPPPPAIVWSVHQGELSALQFLRPPCVVNFTVGAVTTCGPYPVSNDSTGLVTSHLTLTLTVSP